MIYVVYWGKELYYREATGSNRLLYREGHAQRDRIHVVRDMLDCHGDEMRMEYSHVETHKDAKEMS